MPQFLRKIELAVDTGEETLVISDLHVEFDIEYDTSTTPARGTFDVRNLSPDSRRRITESGKRLRFRAGYEGADLSLFADGDISRVEHKVEPPDHVTTIHFAGNSLAQRRAVFVADYPGQPPVETPVANIVRDAIATFDGLKSGNLDAIPADVVETDFSKSGQTNQILKSLLHPLELRHYEQYGEINVTRYGEAVSSGLTISEDTGMIGSPEIREDRSLRVQMRLSSRLVLGDSTRIRSARTPVGGGEWKVVGIRHSGDNHAGDFQTIYDLRAMD